MNRASLALIAISLATSALMAQRADRDTYPAVRQTLDGAVCFPAPFYQNCSYEVKDHYGLDLYRFWAYSSYWNSMRESDPPQPGNTRQSAEPPPLPPPPVTPVTPVLHEYSWPEQVNTSTTFSIVTTSGSVYLATMVWVEGGNVHFNSVDGAVREIPLSSVSRSLTETANARKNLNLGLPWTQAATPNIEALPEEPGRSASHVFVGDGRPFSYAY